MVEQIITHAEEAKILKGGIALSTKIEVNKKGMFIRFIDE